MTITMIPARVGRVLLFKPSFFQPYHTSTRLQAVSKLSTKYTSLRTRINALDSKLSEKVDMMAAVVDGKVVSAVSSINAKLASMEIHTKTTYWAVILGSFSVSTLVYTEMSRSILLILDSSCSGPSTPNTEHRLER